MLHFTSSFTDAMCSAAPRRQLFIPAFVSRLDPSDLLMRTPAPKSKCRSEQQQHADVPSAPKRLPSARMFVQSLIVQMSNERLEKSRQCALPYFSTDSMITAYIDSRLKFCENPKSDTASVLGSSLLGPSQIYCLPLNVLSQLDQPTLCEAHAVAMQLPLVVNSEGNSPWLHLQHGALLGSCTKLGNIPPKVLTHCLHDWFEQAFRSSSNVTCDEWIEEDTYIISRHDSLSSWHTLNDMWFSFLSASIFNLQPSSSRLIFADSQPPGPALPFWLAAFTQSVPLSLLQLAKQAMRRGTRTLCFRRAIFNPSATTSVLERSCQFVPGRMACNDNLLLQAFAAHSRALMNGGDAPLGEDGSALSLYILKDDQLPPSSHDLFALLQRQFSSSASIAVASVKRTPFGDIVNSLARASILLATSDAAAAFAVYLRPLSSCISLQFDEAPLLRMKLVTSWARIIYYKSATLNVSLPQYYIHKTGPIQFFLTF